MKNIVRWNRNRDHNTAKIVAGALAGIAVGFTAGLLTAPRSGREIRGILSERTGEALKRAGNIRAANRVGRALEEGLEEFEK